MNLENIKHVLLNMRNPYFAPGFLPMHLCPTGAAAAAHDAPANTPLLIQTTYYTLHTTTSNYITSYYITTYVL